MRISSSILLLAISVLGSAAPLPVPQQGNMKQENSQPPKLAQSASPATATSLKASNISATSTAAAAATATPDSNPLTGLPDPVEEPPNSVPDGALDAGTKPINGAFNSLATALQKLPLPIGRRDHPHSELFNSIENTISRDLQSRKLPLPIEGVLDKVPLLGGALSNLGKRDLETRAEDGPFRTLSKLPLLGSLASGLGKGKRDIAPREPIGPLKGLLGKVPIINSFTGQKAKRDVLTPANTASATDPLTQAPNFGINQVKKMIAMVADIRGVTSKRDTIGIPADMAVEEVVRATMEQMTKKIQASPRRRRVLKGRADVSNNVVEVHPAALPEAVGQYGNAVESAVEGTVASAVEDAVAGSAEKRQLPTGLTALPIADIVKNADGLQGAVKVLSELAKLSNS